MKPDMCRHQQRGSNPAVSQRTVRGKRVTVGQVCGIAMTPLNGRILMVSNIHRIRQRSGLGVEGHFDLLSCLVTISTSVARKLSSGSSNTRRIFTPSKLIEGHRYKIRRVFFSKRQLNSQDMMKKIIWLKSKIVSLERANPSTGATLIQEMFEPPGWS